MLTRRMVALVRSTSVLWLCLRLLAFPTCPTKAKPALVEKKRQSIEPVDGCWVFGRNSKSGTSTLAHILGEWQTRYDVDHLPFGWATWLDVEKGKNVKTVNPTMVSGEYTEALHAIGGGSDCKWFTIFRHPIPRLVSAYYYCKYKWPNDAPCGKGALDVENADFFTFAKFWSNYGIRHFIEAFVTPEEVLASPSVQAVDPGISGWYKIGLYANELYANETGNGTAAHFSDVHDAAMYKFLQPAMDRISNEYAAVGILEDFDDTLHLLNRALQIPRLDWVKSYRKLGPQNTGASRMDEEKEETLRLAWTDSSIHKYIWLDMLLYDHAVSVYRTQLVEYGLA